MTRTIVKLAGTGLLSLMLSTAVMAPSASAQVDDAIDPVRVDRVEDDGFDWSWLGLLGLLGLAGLMRRGHHDDEHHHTTVRTTPRAETR